MYSVNIKAVYFFAKKKNTNFIYILFIFYDFVLIYRPPELVKTDGLSFMHFAIENSRISHLYYKQRLNPACWFNYNYIPSILSANLRKSWLRQL